MEHESNLKAQPEISERKKEKDLKAMQKANAADFLSHRLG